MGQNKAFIEVDGSTIIERAIGVFKGVFDEVFIAANDVLLYSGLDTRVVADVFKGAGSLGGVYTALFYANGDHVFVAACDMPFLDPACIRRVLKEKRGCNAVTPLIDNRPHPMHTLYSKYCMKQIEAMIKEENLRITDLFGLVHTKYLGEEAFTGMDIRSSVINVNTQEELQRITGGNG